MPSNKERTTMTPKTEIERIADIEPLIFASMHKDFERRYALANRSDDDA